VRLILATVACIAVGAWLAFAALLVMDGTWWQAVIGSFQIIGLAIAAGTVEH